MKWPFHPNRSYESFFFTTSNPGGKAPDVGTDAPPLISATDIGELKKMDIIVTCQGGDYTNDVHPKLRAEGWPGVLDRRSFGSPVRTLFPAPTRTPTAAMGPH